jgi:two-component system phosphate regulon sensor histidine kinase PhoR
MPTRSSSRPSDQRELRARLIRGLPSCGTEADIVQLLYSELHPVFGYDPINLQVLEREGWYQHLAIDHGLLQDVGRRRLSESIFGANYERAESVVGYPTPAKHRVPAEARGPGGDRAPQTVIWVPIPHRGRVIGAVIYQLYTRRQVSARERALLEEVHAHMGVVVNSAYLNELTRNQAVSLGALNTIARALSATRDESEVIAALRNTLGPLLPIDELELVVLNRNSSDRMRVLTFVEGTLIQEELRAESPQAKLVERIHASGQPLLNTPRSPTAGWRSAAWLPIKEGGDVSAVLSIRSREANAYEQSTLIFLQQVADQVGLALRNAWSYADVERQAKDLEIVNAALDRQAETMEAILRNAPVGVVLESADGRVIYVNPVIERIYGLAAERLIGQPAAKLLAQTGTGITEATSPEGPVEVRLGDKVVQIRRVPIPDSSGQQGGLLTLHEDVTEQRAILDAKDLMLRAVGHEVRSPAAAMRATIASLLQWDQLMEPRQRRGVLEDAYEQSERLLNLVEAQLIIAKLEAGGFQPTPVPVSLKETGGQVERVLSNRYGERVSAVRFRFPARLADACCEPVHLEQALTNLIGNALEHAWATRIVVTARDQDGWLEVSVQDNGRGLPSDRVESLFRRAPAGQHRARGGLGLGLYLCRLIVERSFSGRVWLEQTGAKGSLFKFTVPAVVPPQTHIDKRSRGARRPTRVDG